MKDLSQGRKWLVLAALVVFAMLVAPVAGHAGQKVRFVYSSVHMGYLPRIVALEKGFFAQEGLEIDATNIPGGSKAAAALLGGSCDIVNLAYFHALKAARKGFDVVAFACPLNQWPLAYLMKPEMMKKKGITVNSTIDEKIRAMKGLRIGCTSPGSGTDLIPRAFLKNRGIDPNTEVQIVPFGKWKAGVAAFEKGKLDVFQWVSPIPEMLEQKGIGTIVFSMARGEVPEFNGYMWDSFFTTHKYMKAHPDVILAFTKAIIRAIDYINTDKQGTIEIIGRTWKEATPELREASYENMRKAIPRVPELTKAGWEINMRLHFQDATPEEKARMAFEKTAATEFVPRAMKELGK
ncbi:MAG: ABC transporter substrate-binding protein [Deltaproteobacteria bacterium]|nr:ABC transporter substrate-binding protein [Deltaproteobacteria bacterium]